MQIWYPLANKPPAECQRCGNCCASAFIALYSVRQGQDHLEIARWLKYHHLNVKWWKFEGEEEAVLRIQIPYTCQQMGFDGRTGQTFCRIYDTRPQICRDHLCVKVRNASSDCL